MGSLTAHSSPVQHRRPATKTTSIECRKVPTSRWAALRKQYANTIETQALRRRRRSVVPGSPCRCRRRPAASTASAAPPPQAPLSRRAHRRLRHWRLFGGVTSGGSPRLPHRDQRRTPAKRNARASARRCTKTGGGRRRVSCIVGRPGSNPGPCAPKRRALPSALLARVVHGTAY